jgi:hypothetical protein
VKTEHDTELIPGTEILLQGHDGSSRDSDNRDKLVLIPTPSNNPDDPLVSNKNPALISNKF